jgi:bifunctional UDP-N-acetylglucosamine pyrophosphorylase/glucosamine-1-phosphate N-acetyltransferase
VKIGAGSYIGSGSVITREVPEDALVVERNEQVTRPGWAKRYRERKTDAKKKD